MYKNYLYLLRGITELEPILKNCRLMEVYTQEKDKLFLCILTQDKEIFHIILSTTHNDSFITTKYNIAKAKKNTRNFWSDFLPDKITGISIADSDRVIRIELDSSYLYFLIRGSKSNVIFLRDGRYSPFKKISSSDLKILGDELSNLKFISSFEQLLSVLRKMNKDEILKKYRFVDKDILNEFEFRSRNKETQITSIFNEIVYDSIRIDFDTLRKIKSFKPTSFNSIPQTEEHLIFESYFEAINKYNSISGSQGNISAIKSEIDKHLNQRIEKIAGKLNDLKARVDTGSKENEYSEKAHLLLGNIHLLKKGLKNIEVKDLDGITTVRIPLDEKLSPSQNVDRFFEKSKNERINFNKSVELYKSTEHEYFNLINIRESLNTQLSIQELLEIKNKLKIRSHMNSKTEEEKINFRHYQIDNKYDIYVGKDSKNNDLLTTRFAKQNDLWFHARSVPGSHVILRVVNTKEPVPKSIIKKAASVAAFYSKAKTSGLVPVSYTFRKYVTKKKNLDPGQVILLKEEVVLVEPEIPKDVIQITDDPN